MTVRLHEKNSEKAEVRLFYFAPRAPPLLYVRAVRARPLHFDGDGVAEDYF